MENYEDYLRRLQKRFEKAFFCKTRVNENGDLILKLRNIDKPELKCEMNLDGKSLYYFYENDYKKNKKDFKDFFEKYRELIIQNYYSGILREYIARGYKIDESKIDWEEENYEN